VIKIYDTAASTTGEKKELPVFLE